MGPPLSEGTFKGQKSKNGPWAWEQEINPVFVILNFCWRSGSPEFWPTEFPSHPVSLSLSRGHLRIKLYPYHFQVIMIREPSKVTHFPPQCFQTQCAPGRMRTHFPSLCCFLPLRSFVPFHLSIYIPHITLTKGHSSWKQWFGFTSYLQKDTIYAI